jgi:charged multivesicular body protein 2A
MAEAMRNTAKAMAKMNKAVDAKTISKMMAEFERENMKTELMQEVMGDAIDDALADDEAEEEQEKIVNQVLDEIGVTFGEGTSHGRDKFPARMLNTVVIYPQNYHRLLDCQIQ